MKEVYSFLYVFCLFEARNVVQYWVLIFHQ